MSIVTLAGSFISCNSVPDEAFDVFPRSHMEQAPSLDDACFKHRSHSHRPGSFIRRMKQPRFCSTDDHFLRTFSAVGGSDKTVQSSMSAK
jgi:hypothetical protein